MGVADVKIVADSQVWGIALEKSNFDIVRNIWLHLYIPSPSEVNVIKIDSNFTTMY